VKVKALISEFTEKAFKSLVDELNTFFSHITLADNFSGKIQTVVLDAGAEVELSHGLDVVPKYRIILRQSAGDNLITDGDTPWSDKVIYLKNNGASSATVTVLIMRG